MSRTPTPWAADVFDDGSFSIYSDAKVLCARNPWPSRAEMSRANAAFIVRACNSHDALVAALESLLAEYGAWTGFNDDGFSETAIEDARAALARAKE